MITIRRIRYKDWFIQSRKTRWPVYYGFIAWASREPSDNDLTAKGDVYFNFRNSELEAIEVTMKELDSLGDNSHGND